MEQVINKADKGRKFEKGGDTMATKKPMPKGLFGNKESKGEEKAEKKAFPTKAGYKKAEAKFEGETVKKFAKGGGIEIKGKTKGKQIVMKKGGKC